MSFKGEFFSTCFQIPDFDSIVIRTVISGSSDRTIKIWDLETGEETATFTGESLILSCAVASDGVT
ncbi:MAG: hypothetical protein ACKPEQ_22315, partial [Dolichospermum sp.]